MKSILESDFYHDGRGPELIRVHYGGKGSMIEAVDFYNPDDAYEQKNLKHLVFSGSQAFCFTPEEEYSGGFPNIDWQKFGKAAVINLGKTDWYRTFTNLHSKNCDHYRLMFYDEILDVICERIIFVQGGYSMKEKG